MNNHFVSVMILKSALFCNLFYNIFRPRSKHGMFSAEYKNKLKDKFKPVAHGSTGNA